MTGLVIKLAPRERILINGAVIENGDRRGRFAILSPSANILRLRDAIHPDEANTPVKRVCYIAQLVLSGDIEAGDARAQLLSGIEQLSQVLVDENSSSHLAAATRFVMDGKIYQALKSLRALLSREERLFARNQP